VRSNISRGVAAMLNAERYIAFLLSTLPRLAARRLYSPHWPFPMRRFAVLDRALRSFTRRPGVAIEFGVYRGTSLRRTAKRCHGRQVYGFDSFCGLPADGRPDWGIDFAVSKLPPVPSNCQLMPGWFADTIPDFLQSTNDPVGFVNIDCDIYSSTREVLFGLADRLQPGAVLYFDELINYDTFLWNEMLALFEFLEDTGFGVEWLAVHCRVREAKQVLAELDTGRYPPWREDVAAGYHRPAAALLTATNPDLRLLQTADPEKRIASLARDFERQTQQFEERRQRPAEE
jgi:hypothetical protein